jgi:regulator of G-protein signaling
MSSRQQQKMTPEHGLSMLPLLSPLLLSTAAPSAAAMSRHAPGERAAHSPAPPGGTPMLYSKMQAIAQRMLHSEQGVPIKSYKRRLISAIPSAFTGSDLVVWLMSNLNLDSKEAVHFGRIMVAHGYFFSVEGSVALRDDGTLFRFQTPYYWPSQNPVTTDFEYGVYLVKQVLRSKNKIRLLDYELTNLHKMKPKLANVWRDVTDKAEEAVKIFREQKRVARAIMNSQEEAFWRLHRPAPNEPCVGESLLTRHFCQRPSWHQQEVTEGVLRAEVRFLRRYSMLPRVHVSIAVESLIGHCSKYREFDPMLTPVSPSNPWISGDETLWDVERSLMETPNEWQLRRWACSFSDLLNDVTGRYHFEKFCKKQFCSENIKFWQTCRDLRSIPLSAVEGSVKLIYE